MARTGRPVIFTDKSGKRLQATLTKPSTATVEKARRALAKLVNWPVGRVSDSDVVEYLIRGHKATLVYLEKLR